MLYIVFFTVFLDMIGFGLVLPLLPLYVESMGGTAQTVGFILSSFSATQFFATPVLGKLSDRYGRRNVILVSLIGNAISMAVFAAATWFAMLPLLFASRILAGATAGNLSACQAAVADVTSREERAKGMGLLGAGIGLGMVFGPFLGGEASHWGAAVPPLLAAAMALVDFFVVLALMPETSRIATVALPSSAGTHPMSNPASAPVTEAPPGSSALSDPVGPGATPAVPPTPLPRRPLTLWSTLNDPRLGAVLVLVFLSFLILSNMQVALALLGRERLGWGEKEVGRAFVLFGFTMMVIQGALIGRLARRFGELNLAIFGAISMGCGMVLISMAWSAPVLLAGVFVFASGVGVNNPALSSLASRYAPPDQQGAVLGVVQSSGGLARAIGPTWSGFLFNQLGSSAPFLGGAISAVISMTVGIVVKARGEQPAAASATGSAPDH